MLFWMFGATPKARSEFLTANILKNYCRKWASIITSSEKRLGDSENRDTKNIPQPNRFQKGLTTLSVFPEIMCRLLCVLKHFRGNVTAVSLLKNYNAVDGKPFISLKKTNYGAPRTTDEVFMFYVLRVYDSSCNDTAGVASSYQYVGSEEDCGSFLVIISNISKLSS